MPLLLLRIMIVGLDHIAIISSSDTSVEFYSKLGFKEILRKRRENDTIVILEGQGYQIEIYIDPTHPARATNPEPLGLRHLALSVDDIDSIVNKFECGPINKDWFGRRYCYISDPDGLQIEFVEQG